jgi:hypothetical protein
MANDVALLQVVGAVANEPCEIILAFEASVANSNTPATLVSGLVTVVPTWFQTELLDCLPDDWETFGYKAKRVNNTGGPSQTLPTAGLAGTRGANSISSGQGPVALWPYHDALSTPPAWRTGRTFIPGIAAGDLAENDILPALTLAVQLWQSTIMTPKTDGNGVTWTFVLWSRKNSVKYDINATAVSGVIGTQRRRLHPSL